MFRRWRSPASDVVLSVVTVLSLGCSGGKGMPAAGGAGGAAATAGGTGGSAGDGGAAAGGDGGDDGGAAATGGASGAGVVGTGGRVAGSTGGTGAAAGGRGGVAGTGGRGAAGVGGAAGAGGAPTLATTSMAVRIANAVMTRWPDPVNIHTSLPAWEYNRGIVLRGIEQVYRRTGDLRYLAYIQKYADEFVSPAGVVNIPVAHSFDNIQPAVLLPFLFQQTGDARYRIAAEQIRARFDSIPRNPDNGFWHKQTYPNQMWLDSIYMANPFLMRYGTVFGTCGNFCSDTIAEQVLLIAAHVRDTATGLLYHAWDDSPAGMKAPWANPTTGRSSVVWGRAMGWTAMALVDILPDFPVSNPARAQMLSVLNGIATALQATQDPATGLWFQVLDQGARTDNWIETSGSAMFVYALKVAVNRGYIGTSHLAVANRGWQGLLTKITTDAAGLPTVIGAVQGMGVQIDYTGYINQLPTLANSSHGLCAVLLAASEMEAQP